MALCTSGIQIELREISLKKRPKELYEISSKGTVPVLHQISGNIIDESIEIMYWAILEYGLNWCKIDSQYQKVAIKKNDMEFKKWLDKYKYFERYPESSQDYYRDNASDIIEEYDLKLNNYKYILGDNLQLIDIAIFPFIRQFAKVDIIWFNKRFNNLYNWFVNIENSELFKIIMKKYDFWESQQYPCIINYSKEHI